MSRRINHLLKTGLILTSLVATSVVANEAQTKKDLSDIQSALQKTKAELEGQRKSIADMRKDLRAHELDIAKNAKALNLAAQSVKENEQQQREQQAKAQQLQAEQIKRQTLLAAQLKSAYMAGSHDYSKMLLNQQDTAKIERTLSYYNYLNKARIEQLEELKALQIKIAENQAELEQTKLRLVELHNEQKKRQQALIAAQEQRKRNLNKLQSALKETKSSIDYLKENEKTLVTAIEELEKERSEKVELLGLQSSKGKLNWPTKGKLRHSFGQRKHGNIDWKGVLIGAKEGSNVKSVQNGQVVYADWLNGFGWVIAIDHGDGFMSLYGHAQTLLRDVGDLVREGEVIALVGQSGGQTDPGLYFEIRHKGRAVNPVKWCRRI
ncbi:protease [Pseudoalteromonas lipolytica]|jgi:septal ring factor EnvC (AmiA/AmiB activator)|uniref:Protease n=1 Tax=Pseudoalteromonas lipolytica TaxID=570156 RepID=A0AAD0S1U0_9GAMM|nr:MULTISPECIES: peptidoglycan DD-metalloendopeptidase family protein [Pseudoalteromonas]AXV66282.1 protease [Pseudoalteromonas donghaensis]MCC9659966.1 peptidoglycan DD-metalloendopeptidase family protein [Pseudoalteromonas sp. MB41]QLJ07796.1 peptidoglycan DD-metalloendopeptidase family protein [Pseudoalteromonas sp. JSTW]QPL42416.1 peptidoglycan DD-metalloendopeptidase family protein [Pseudoalteromonas sp. A41-2]